MKRTFIACYVAIALSMARKIADRIIPPHDQYGNTYLLMMPFPSSKGIMGVFGTYVQAEEASRILEKATGYSFDIIVRAKYREYMGGDAGWTIFSGAARSCIVSISIYRAMLKILTGLGQSDAMLSKIH